MNTDDPEWSKAPLLPSNTVFIGPIEQVAVSPGHGCGLRGSPHLPISPG
jgi:hypothetical protein